MGVALTTETNWGDPPTVQLLQVLAFQGKYKEAAEHYGRARAFHAAVEMCPPWAVVFFFNLCGKASLRYTLKNRHFEPPKIGVLYIDVSQFCLAALNTGAF